MSALYWLTRGVTALAGKIPRPVRYSLSSGLSSASYLGWREKRLVTQQNMAKVLGLPVSDQRVRRTAFASWSNYGRTASDLLYFPHMNMDDIDARCWDQTRDSTWQEVARQGLEASKGLVIASAHFGSWDIAGALFARYFPLSGVTETFADPQFNAMMQGHRIAKQVGIIPLENASRQVLRKLQANQAVAIVVDRPMSKEKGVEITFFGHKTYVPGGPAALALKSGAAIMPGFVWYGLQQRLYVRAFPLIYPRPCQGPAQRKLEIARLTQCIYNALEELVGEWPTQWFMFRSFWPSAEAEQE
ncbi:MAG TPA: lysophospholipid acyltransferase family protein [Ktedonobacteraceae bacterium]